MARIRQLKPSFFRNEHLGRLSPLHRLAFAGLWGEADREGRLEDRPARLRISILPYDQITDVEFDAILTDLSEPPGRHIRRYVVDERRIIAIEHFLHHQNPHPKEPVSDLPPPPPDPGEPSEPRQAAAGRGKEGKASGEPLEGPAGSSGSSGSSDPNTHAAVVRIFEFWKWALGHPRALLSPARTRHLRARFKDGYDAADLERAVVGLATSRHHRGINDTGEVFDDLLYAIRTGDRVEKFRDRVTSEQARAWVALFDAGAAPPPGPGRRIGPARPPAPETDPSALLEARIRHLDQQIVRLRSNGSNEATSQTLQDLLAERAETDRKLAALRAEPATDPK